MPIFSSLTRLVLLLSLLAWLPSSVLAQSALSHPHLTMLNKPYDVSPDFVNRDHFLYVARKLESFDPATRRGSLRHDRSQWKVHFLFNHMNSGIEPIGPNEFPGGEYPHNPSLPFAVDFISPRTLRIRTSATPITDAPSLMLVGQPPTDTTWNLHQTDSAYQYTSPHGTLTIHKDPFSLELRDSSGKLLTSTRTQGGSQPFSFLRRNTDFSRSVAASFSLSPGEKIMGLGENFGPLNKRGQRIVLCTTDVLGAEKQLMYKPIPFFFSSRDYGIFVHTSAPVTADVGSHMLSTTTLYSADEDLDLFIFLGEPKDILYEYTALTGRPNLPPLWSFGLWMSRITYKSEQEVRTVAAKLRENRIPTDVIHLDTGWFQTDWHCDYKFSPDRFTDPQKMIQDLRAAGFRTSLWQLPYFVPKNPLFPELVASGLAVRNAKGNLPTDDVILDFSNPQTVRWYQDKLAGLLNMGVAAIKTDFGEAAPYNGIYASGRSGLYEHNLYPLRYQQAVHGITKQITGHDIIFARAAWAGSQRFPLHWSGDSSCNDGSMAATLRAGLSLGSSGFTFWSHDIGGFAGRPNAELYARWAAFGLLTSHSRCHGDPPREPWEYGPDFQNTFRSIVELKYRLLPYIYAQAKDSANRGLPMLRALYIEYPNDPGSWLIDDQYLFGSSLLVAPMLEANVTSRNVYLPPGSWIDYQTGKSYTGGTWHHIAQGPIPIILLVKSGSLIPEAAIAQSTDQIDFSLLTLKAFATSPSEPFTPALLLTPLSPHLLTINLNPQTNTVTQSPASLDSPNITPAATNPPAIIWSVQRITP